MKKTVKMKIVTPRAAGIDIGSRSHFVAVGQGENDVKEFSVARSGHLERYGFYERPVLPQ